MHVLKSHSLPDGPASDCIANPKFLSHCKAQPPSTHTLGIHFQSHFRAAGIDIEGINSDTVLTHTSSWSIPVPVALF